jgi:hypothetical protein
MTFTTKKSRLNISAFAIAAVAFTALHASMLMGFEQLASAGHNSVDTGSRVATSTVAPRTVVLERVVISIRRA